MRTFTPKTASIFATQFSGEETYNDFVADVKSMFPESRVHYKVHSVVIRGRHCQNDYLSLEKGSWFCVRSDKTSFTQTNNQFRQNYEVD